MTVKGGPILLSLYTGIGFASFCINSWRALTGVFCKSPTIDMLDIELSIPDATGGILPIEDQFSNPIWRSIDAFGALCKLTFDIVRLGETIPLGAGKSAAWNSDLSIVLVALEKMSLLGSFCGVPNISSTKNYYINYVNIYYNLYHNYTRGRLLVQFHKFWGIICKTGTNCKLFATIETVNYTNNFPIFVKLFTKFPKFWEIIYKISYSDFDCFRVRTIIKGRKVAYKI